ncbi:MAG: Trk family potassium uptake protein [Lachnospiraceae bacterium]|nr:Trk family potassium uptake protein [Lachnospiraceae bacterium]
MVRKQRKQLSQTQTIALGFLFIILTGTVLLMLPISSRSGEVTPFLDALFTAVSASCVTGLVVVDTYTHWTLFGQAVILLMIQIGGLGFMTIGILFSILLRRKISLRERGLMQESVNTLEIGGIIKLARKIIKGTFLIEGIGAVVLAVRFGLEMGPWKGIYYGIFHSISAFCNAGFDLMGYQEEYVSLVNYAGDIVVNVTIILLIVIGGIGFIVWDDVTRHGLKFKKYMLHTKIVLTATAVLIVTGAFLFWILERDNILAGRGTLEQLLCCLFASVTARTAGFNTVDIAGLTDAGKFLNVVLMFIGGNPGSTAGGIKTTTIVVLIMYIWSNMKHTYGCNLFGRRLENESIVKASAVFCTNLFLATAAVLFISAVQVLPVADVLTEVFSAIGTVGMSTGITRELTVPSRIAIMMLMYCGRIGSLSFALSFTQKKKTAPVQQPVERINIG